MLSRRTLLVLSGASLLASCSQPMLPPVVFQVEPDAAGPAVRVFEDFTRRFGYRAQGPLGFLDIFGSPSTGEGAEYRAWRSEFYLSYSTEQPRKYSATFQPMGWLALSYDELGAIAEDLARVLRSVDGVLVDENFY